MTKTELDDIKKTLDICIKDEKCDGCPLDGQSECTHICRLQAIDAIKILEKELIDERYRHDRLQDWTIARDRQHEAAMHALFTQMQQLCRQAPAMQRNSL